jgi:PAS domain S-box-containing protein
MYETTTEAISETTLDELRSSALLLEVIADNVADLIAVVDCTGRRIWNNFAYAERLGYSPDELKGSDSMVEIHPDDLALVRETFQKSMEEGCGRRIEYRMRRKDGNWVTLESEGRVARNWNGHERCLVVVSRDITSRKEAEREKQERSQRQIERAQALADFAGSEELQVGALEICFGVVAEAAVKLTTFPRASVWTLDEETQVLLCVHRSGQEDGEVSPHSLAKADAPGLFVLMSRERVIAARCIEEDERLKEIAGFFTSEGVTALLIVPLRRGSAVLGALICERTDLPHGWDLDEVTFATSLADGLVLAIDARDRLNAYHRLHESQQQLASELREAANYVQSLLPPCGQGEIDADWRFIPSDALGGDAFGHHWIDPDHLAIYLLDVVGHGVRAALVSVAVINQLRTGSLAGTDFLDPKQVLTALNEAFQMDEQDGMYFTLWYGIYDKAQRHLYYASAGHPPALLFAKDGTPPRQLHTRGLMIGAFPGAQYEAAECTVDPGSQLYVFSDGVYEIEQADGKTATLADLIATLARGSDLDQVVAAARALQRPGVTGFADDFSLLRLKLS